MAKDPHTRGQERNGVSPQIETQLRNRGIEIQRFVQYSNFAVLGHTVVLELVGLLVVYMHRQAARHI